MLQYGPTFTLNKRRCLSHHQGKFLLRVGGASHSEPWLVKCRRHGTYCYTNCFPFTAFYLSRSIYKPNKRSVSHAGFSSISSTSKFHVAMETVTDLEPPAGRSWTLRCCWKDWLSERNPRCFPGCSAVTRFSLLWVWILLRKGTEVSPTESLPGEVVPAEHWISCGSAQDQKNALEL